MAEPSDFQDIDAVISHVLDMRNSCKHGSGRRDIDLSNELGEFTASVDEYIDARGFWDYNLSFFERAALETLHTVIKEELDDGSIFVRQPLPQLEWPTIFQLSASHALRGLEPEPEPELGDAYAEFSQYLQDMEHNSTMSEDAATQMTPTHTTLGQEETDVFQQVMQKRKSVFDRVLEIDIQSCDLQEEKQKLEALLEDVHERQENISSEREKLVKGLEEIEALEKLTGDWLERF